MRTRYGTSPWTHEFPASRRPDHPRFRGERIADVVIVGGGLTACAAAQACAAAGLDTVLLEKDRLGHGATGRGAGLLTAEPGPAFRNVAAVHGLRSARRVFDAWRRGVLDGSALIRRLGITCGLEQQSFMLIAAPGGEKLLRREHEARTAAGLDAASLSSRQLAKAMKLEADGALRMRAGFTLDPYRACIGMAAAAARRGAAIFEHSHVRKVRFTRRHADVVVDGGTIRTKRVVVATGSATAEFKALQRHFKQRDMFLVRTEPVPAAIKKEIVPRGTVLRDTRMPPRRVQWTSEGGLLVAGGDREETPTRTRNAVLVQRTGQLMYELLTMYPAISGLQPEYGWEASYGETADGLMYIGAHRNFPHHLFALGGASDSVTGAFVAARIIVRAVQGTPDKADEVFSWTR